MSRSFFIPAGADTALLPVRQATESGEGLVRRKDPSSALLRRAPSPQGRRLWLRAGVRGRCSIGVNLCLDRRRCRSESALVKAGGPTESSPRRQPWDPGAGLDCLSPGGAAEAPARCLSPHPGLSILTAHGVPRLTPWAIRRLTDCRSAALEVLTP